MYAAASRFACAQLQISSVAPAPVSLKELVNGSNSSSSNSSSHGHCEPVLLITSPGADPTAELADLADSVVGKERYHEVAMGQGQADVALQLLKECAETGKYCCDFNLLQSPATRIQHVPSFAMWSLIQHSHPVGGRMAFGALAACVQ